MADAQRDKDVVARVLQGDREAYSALVEEYSALVRAMIARYVPRDSVDDVSQIVFLEAYNGLASFRGEAAFGTWISGIALRQSYQYWRREKRHRAWLDPEVRNKLFLTLESEPEGTAQSKFEAQELSTVLHWALSQLSAEDRMVMTLVHLEDRSVKEVAEQLGWTKTNVKVRAFRARKKLKTLLERAKVRALED